MPAGEFSSLGCFYEASTKSCEKGLNKKNKCSPKPGGSSFGGSSVLLLLAVTRTPVLRRRSGERAATNRADWGRIMHSTTTVALETVQPSLLESSENPELTGLQEWREFGNIQNTLDTGIKNYSYLSENFKKTKQLVFNLSLWWYATFFTLGVSQNYYRFRGPANPCPTLNLFLQV